MAETIVELLTDVADAIREKKGSNEPINAQNFADEIRTIESGGSGWTGHADVEGLKAIGWDDEDIAYYQKHGVNWNEEDDEYHKVSDDNKALYGVLTVDNIQDYKDRIVYLPKIDTSGKTNLEHLFQDCISLVAIPMIDISQVTHMRNFFYACRALTCFPLLDTSNAIDIQYMINGCPSLLHFPQLNTSKVTNMAQFARSCRNLKTFPHLDTSLVKDMSYMFDGCWSLESYPELDTTNAQQVNYMFSECPRLKSISSLNVSKAGNLASTFKTCNSLTSISELDCSNIANTIYTFDYCYSLVKVKLKNLKVSVSFSTSSLLHKESLLYIINNEAATSAITITLHSYAYQRLAEDTDIVEALNNHPLISLASA